MKDKETLISSQEMQKSIETAMINYWQTHHNLDIFKDEKKDKLGLDVVCVTGMPLYYNKLLNFFNVFNFKNLMKKVGTIHDKTVLDIGCGTGRWCKLLSQMGANVTGIDLSPERMKNNQKKLPNVKFLTMSATDLKFEDSTFDIITSVVVIQHIHHDLQRKVAREISRVLKKGGYLLLVEGTKEDEAIRYKYSFPNSTPQWIDLFEREGLKLEETNKVSNFFLVEHHVKLRDKIRKKLFGTPVVVQQINNNNILAYDCEGLLQSKETYKHKKTITKQILKTADNLILFVLVLLSYPLEFFNCYVLKYYPTSEQGFLFVKK